MSEVVEIVVRGLLGLGRAVLELVSYLGPRRRGDEGRGEEEQS